jgi:hypothetical protein
MSSRTYHLLMQEKLARVRHRARVTTSARDAKGNAWIQRPESGTRQRSGRTEGPRRSSRLPQARSTDPATRYHEV